MSISPASQKNAVKKTVEKNRDRMKSTTAYALSDISWLFAREKWTVETMHCFLDVHFGEDYCRIENKTVQQNFNMLRKFSLKLIKLYKQNSNPKRPL